MARASRTFRIFVSSTFADLKEERNALQERVWPRLREYCLAHGARFQAIDLRWGVSEEAAVDQQTINICLDEVKRCQDASPRPNFIVLLGNRYGWCPPPPQIPTEEFEKIKRRVPEAVALLDEWYPLDRNATPPHHYLKPREGGYRDPARWEPTERELRQILERATEDMPLEAADRLKYTASATELEIDRGAGWAHRDHVFCYFRSIEGLPDDAAAGDFADDPRDRETAEKRLASLKERVSNPLDAENVHGYTARWRTDARPGEVPVTLEHIERLCDEVYEDLLRIIGEEITALGAVDPVQREREAHEAFGVERARFFEGRLAERARIEAYAGAPDGTVLPVFGESGSGKSALMALAAAQAAGRNPDAVVQRFIGVTPDSSSGRGLLEGLCREIAVRWGPPEAEMPIPADYRDLVGHFAERIARAAERRPMVLFLDALDQLSGADGARSLAWLPTTLPARVALVVSTTPGDTLTALRSRLPNERFVEVEQMSREEGAHVLEKWLETAGRTLQGPQSAAVLDAFAAKGRPLFLRLAFEEARRWRSNRTPPALPTEIPEMIRDVLFERLERPENHGDVMVSRSLGYLAAAKNGLSEDEVIEALSRPENGVLTDFRERNPKAPAADRLPFIVWSRLFADLEPYLTERSADEASLMTFYHRQLREAIEKKYLQGQEGLARHRELAAHFADGGLEITGADATTPNLRYMSEVPYQQTWGEMWNEVVATLTNFDFLEKKATFAGVVESKDAGGKPVTTYTGVYQIREDFALALERMPGGSGEGAGDRRRRIIVTGVDFGNGLVIRCPHCNTVSPFQDRWRGDDIPCPNAACNGPLRVNEFVVERT